MKTRERMLSLKVATSPLDFEKVRRIRNECRTFMTGNQKRIGPLQQVIFCLKKQVDRFTVVYIGYNECNKPIAYGLIHYDDRLVPWLSGGLLGAYRGLGYGRKLFEALCAGAPCPVYLDALRDNIPAVRLYLSLGFEIISERTKGLDTIITMRKDCGATDM